MKKYYLIGCLIIFWGLTSQLYAQPAPKVTIFEAQVSGEMFGSSADGGKDINGDGYPDMVVGAKSYGGGQGRVYIYLGGPGAYTTPDMTLTGTQANQMFGESVSLVGDMNKDGFADIVVADLNGSAYLYYGGASISNTPAQTFSLTGGNYVCRAGDVNGDGYADMIYGELNPSPYKKLITEANLYYGGVTVDAVADVRFNNNLQILSVNAAGDVNNDGFDDVLLADFQVNPNRKNPIIDPYYLKNIYVYYGSANMDTLPDRKLEPVDWGPSNGWFGHYLNGAGDLNSDGYDDILVSGAAGAGNKFHIFYGGASMNTRPDKTIRKFRSNSQFGSPAAGVGDMNGDGQVDIIVGAKGDAIIHTDFRQWGDGWMNIFFGGPNMDDLADLQYVSSEENDRFAFTSVCGVGNYNNIGGTEAIVCAYNANQGSGRIYMFSLSGSSEPPVSITQPKSGAEFKPGESVTISIATSNHNAMFKQVEFFSGTTSLGIDNSAPYSLTWEVPSSPGKYSLTAMVTYETGNTEVSTKVTVNVVDAVSGVNNSKASTIDGFNLFPNYPNPFNPSTTIQYRVPVTSQVKIVIYDALGREVIRLVDGVKNPGPIHQVTWNGQNSQGQAVAGGNYIYRMFAKGLNSRKEISMTRKLLLIK